MTSVSFPPSRLKSQNAALGLPFSSDWASISKWFSRWSEFWVESDHNDLVCLSPLLTHLLPRLTTPPSLLVQYPLYLGTNCAQIQSSIFVIQHSYKDHVSPVLAPTEKAFAQQKSFLLLEDFVYFFEETPNLSNKKSLRVPGLHSGKQTSIFVSFLRDVLPQ